MGKNLIVCCDGTGNDIARDSTNVLRLFRSLCRDDSTQIAYYDSGVGTLVDPTKISTLGKVVSKKLDMAIGHSVRENVCEAYRFLTQVYEPGDRIYLFGFSRGAYTVRALAGMINFLGLVPSELRGLDRLAWAIYADDDESLAVRSRFAAGNRFKKSFSLNHSVRIHFIGVWDTVSSFGWIWNLRTVPYTSNNPCVAHIRHAVSIDEHRAPFQPNRFLPTTTDQHDSFKELWFAGAHADVGGGYPEKESGLAKIALEWMFNESAAQGCLYDESQIDTFLGRASNRKDISKPDPLAKVHNSTQGLWHALEFAPRKEWDPNAEPERSRWFAPNIYRRRKIPNDAIFHESVELKLKGDPGYRPTNLPRNCTYSR